MYLVIYSILINTQFAIVCNTTIQFNYILKTIPIQQNMIKAAQSTEKQLSIVKLLEQDKKTLEHEINGYRQEAQKQRKIIQQLEKERDRYINETSNLMQKAGSADELTFCIFLFIIILVLQDDFYYLL